MSENVIRFPGGAGTSDPPDDRDDNSPEMADIGAEIHAGGPGPVPGGQAAHRPVLPLWLHDRARLAATLRWAAGHAAHVVAFHAVRLPVYGGRLALASPRGTGRAVAAWWRWVFDTEGSPLRRQTVERLEPDTYIILSRQRNVRVRARARLSAATAALTTLAALITMVAAPRAMTVATLTGIGVLGWIGRRKDKPIITPATLTQATRRLTADVVVRAFISAGLCREDTPVTFAQPIQRDGRGWLALVDLPYGRHYAQAAAKREAIASGLDVSPVTVFCDPDQASARRVRLWVSDVDVFAQRPVISPLAKAERFDLWQPVPFGLDAKDRPVRLPMVWTSLLVGAIPRMGKTYAARLPAAAAALDPHARLLVWDGKGGTDWEPFAQVAHVYATGVRDTVVAHLAATLAALVADMNTRYERLRTLPRELCPEAKVTPAITRNKRLNMPLTLVAIDEVQRYLEHPDHGRAILAALTDLAKVGPAVGIMLLLATQKPSSDVLPDDLRGQIGTRFALKVMTWQASDTILGAGTAKTGLDASRFLRGHKGVGILLGADDSELAEHGGQTVRTHLLDMAALETLCTRGRALRDQNGTLTGMAAGDTHTAPTDHPPTSDILNAVATVFLPGEDKLWSEAIIARLAAADPATYDGWTPAALAAALRPYGAEPAQFWATTPNGRRANRRGYHRDTITDAQTTRLDKP
jgi:DNA segregation ATPase FtsK/SpoIIIE, S-DNA-T family